MASKLADETLCEIFSIAFYLAVIDEFARVREAAPCYDPFNLERPRNVVRVCKRWHRIATPYLYESIEIKSNWAMERLAETLENNPDFGRFIRNLCVNGAYAQHLHTVAKMAPNVRVLGLQAKIASKDSNAGLSKALALLNPTEVWLYQMRNCNDNQKSMGNVTKIFGAMQTKWTSLRKITFISKMLEPLVITSMLSRCLPRVSTLAEIAADRWTLLFWLNDRDFHDLLKRSHIKKIWCIGPQGCLDQDIKEQNMQVPSHVKKMIHYEEKENTWHGTYKKGIAAARNMIDAARC